MIAMTHRLHKPEDNTDKTGMFVHVLSACKEAHEWTVEVTTEDRVKPGKANTSKAFYRLAENILLSAGKIVYLKTELETKAGVEVSGRQLVCKACNGSDDASAE